MEWRRLIQSHPRKHKQQKRQRAADRWTCAQLAQDMHGRTRQTSHTDGICISISLGPAKSSMELMAVQPAASGTARAGLRVVHPAAGCRCRQPACLIVGFSQLKPVFFSHNKLASASLNQSRNQPANRPSMTGTGLPLPAPGSGWSWG